MRYIPITVDIATQRFLWLVEGMVDISVTETKDPRRRLPKMIRGLRKVVMAGETNAALELLHEQINPAITGMELDPVSNNMLSRHSLNVEKALGGELRKEGRFET